MISKRTTTEQLKRLSALGGWHNLEPEAKRELARVLQTAANEQHADSAVTDLVQGRTWIPAPADILEALRSNGPSAEQWEPEYSSDTACKICNDTGVISVEGKLAPRVGWCICEASGRERKADPHYVATYNAEADRIEKMLQERSKRM